MSIFIVLAVILLFAVGAALIQAVNALFIQQRRNYRSHYHRDLLLVDIVVVILYLLVSGIIAVLYISFQYDPIILYFAVGILVLLTAVIFARYLIGHWNTMNQTGMFLFLLWFGVVLYLTLFSRLGTETTRFTVTPFQGLTQAITEGSLAPLEHDFLNILLFVPFGYLIPRSNSRYLSRFGFALLGGIVTSTVIESVQLMTHLGFCDIDDIIANSLGAAVGYGIYCLIQKIQRNWKIV